MRNRQHPELIWGDDMFPRLLPWALERPQYRSGELHNFCTTAYQIDDATQHLRFQKGRLVWHNHVEHALRIMTDNKLHLRPRDNDRVHYKPDHARIQAYLVNHPSDANDDHRSNTLAEFIEATKDMPRSTQAERLTIERKGQGIFRRALMSVFNRRCQVTSIDDETILRASHIKDWASCESDEERMDPDNGLLLAAHIDAAFDGGRLSFRGDGGVLLSPKLSLENVSRLGLDGKITIQMSAKREAYMKWHRRRWDFESDHIRVNQPRPPAVRHGDLFKLMAQSR
jgi:hypothetical protein